MNAFISPIAIRNQNGDNLNSQLAWSFRCRWWRRHSDAAPPSIIILARGAVLIFLLADLNLFQGPSSAGFMNLNISITWRSEAMNPSVFPECLPWTATEWDTSLTRPKMKRKPFTFPSTDVTTSYDKIQLLRDTLCRPKSESRQINFVSTRVKQKWFCDWDVHTVPIIAKNALVSWFVQLSRGCEVITWHNHH